MASNKLADLNLDIKLNIEDNGRIKQLDREFTDFVSKAGNPIKVNINTSKAQKQLASLTNAALKAAQMVSDIQTPRDITKAKADRASIATQITNVRKEASKYSAMALNSQKEAFGKAYNDYIKNPTKANAKNFSVFFDAIRENEVKFKPQEEVRGTKTKYEDISKVYKKVNEQYGFNQDLKDWDSLYRKSVEKVQNQLDIISDDAEDYAAPIKAVYDQWAAVLQERKAFLDEEIKALQAVEDEQIKQQAKAQKRQEKLAKDNAERVRQVEEEAAIKKAQEELGIKESDSSKTQKESSLKEVVDGGKEDIKELEQQNVQIKKVLTDREKDAANIQTKKMLLDKLNSDKPYFQKDVIDAYKKASQKNSKKADKFDFLEKYNHADFEFKEGAKYAVNKSDLDTLASKTTKEASKFEDLLKKRQAALKAEVNTRKADLETEIKKDIEKYNAAYNENYEELAKGSDSNAKSATKSENKPKKSTKTPKPTKSKAKKSGKVEEPVQPEIPKQVDIPINATGNFKETVEKINEQIQKLMSVESIPLNFKQHPELTEIQEKISNLSKEEIPLNFNIEGLTVKLEEISKSIANNEFSQAVDSMNEVMERFSEAFKNVDGVLESPLNSLSQLRDVTTEIKANFKELGISTIKDAKDVYKNAKPRKQVKKSEVESEDVSQSTLKKVKKESEKQLREQKWKNAIEATGIQGVTKKELGNKANGLYSFNQEIATAQGGIKTLRYEFENLEDVLTEEGKFKPDFLESAKDVTSKKAINDNYYKAVKLAQEKDSSLNLKSTNVSSQAGINRITISWEEATGALHKYKVEVEELSSLYGQDGALSLNKVKQFGVNALNTTELLKNFKLAAKGTSLKEYSDIDITSLKKAADGVYTLTASWTEATGAVKQYQVQTSDLSSLIKRNGNLNIQSIKENGHEVLSNKQILENLNKAAKATNLKNFKDISFSNLSQNAEGINEVTASWVNAKGEAQKYKLIVEDINSLMTKAGTISQSTLNNSKRPYVFNQQQLDRLDKIKNSEALSDKFNEDNIVNSIIDNALYYKGRGTKKDPNITVKDRIKTLREEMQKIIKSLEGGDIYNEAEANKKLVSLSKKQKDIDDFYKKYGKGEGFFKVIDKDKVNDIRAITSAVQECVEAQVKLKKTGKDGSMTFEFVKDGQVQEVKAKVKQIKDVMNDINYLDIGKPSSDKVYESYGEKWLTGLRGKIGSLAQYLTGMNAVLTVYNKVKEGFSFAKEMNTSLTTINQTMSVTQDQMNALGQGSIDVGKQLGVDAKNVMNAAEIYANANDTAKGVLDKAQASILLSNASGADTSTTSDQIQGVINQFDNLKGKETEVVNIYEKISANLGIDFAKGITQMSEAVSTAGSVVDAAGMKFSTFAASTGKIAEKTRQDGSTIGNAYKTILARISRSKSADESVTDADRSNASKAFSSVGISLYNSKGEYKDINETLDELSAKWVDLSDAQRNYVSEQAAGIRNINTFTALMNTWQDAKKLAADAENDSDFYESVQEKHMDSIEGKMARLSATSEDFWYNLFNSNMIKGGVDGINLLATAFDGLFKVIQKVPIIGDGTSSLFKSLLGVGLAGFGNSVIDKTLQARTFDKQNPEQATGIGRQIKRGFKNAWTDFKLTGTNDETRGKNQSLFNVFKSGFKEARSNGQNAFSAIKAGSDSAKTSMSGTAKVVTSLAKALIVMDVATKLFDAFSTSAKEAKEAVGKSSATYKEQTSALKENKTTIASIKDEWSNLSKGVNTNTNENIALTSTEFEKYLDLNKQIANIVPEAISGYDAQGNAILNLKGNVEALNEALEKQEVSQATKRIKDNLDSYQDAAKQTNGQTNRFDQFATFFSKGLNGFTKGSGHYYADIYGNQKAYNALSKLQSYTGEKDFDKVKHMFSKLYAVNMEDMDLADYLQENFGKVKTYADWKKVLNSGGLQNELSKQQQAIKATADTNKELLNDYITTLTKGDGEFSYLSDELSNNITALLTKADDKTINKLTANGGLEKFARDYFSKIGKSKDAQNALSNLLSINKETDIDKIQSILENDLTTLSKTLGVKKKTLELQLDLKGANEAVAKVEDVYKNAKKFDNVQKKTTKSSNKEVKAKKRLGQYIKDNALHTADQLELLDQCVQDAQTLDEAFRQYETQKYKVEVDMNSLDDLKANLTTVKEEIEAINQAKTDSNSSSGMTLEDIKKVKDAYSSVEGIDYDYSKLFEQTYSGMHLNAKELSKLQGQYEKIEYDKYTGKVEKLQEKYQGLCADIARTGDAQDKYNKIQERDNVLEQIQQAKEYQSVYEGMTNSVNKWKNAQSYTLSDEIASGYEDAKKLFDGGWFGDETFQAYTQMFTNKDLSGSGSEVYANLFNQKQATMKRYLTKDSRLGISNFIQDIAKIIPSAKGMIDGNNDVDWSKMPSVDTISETMDLSKGFVDSMFKLANKAGADLDFSEAADNLRKMRDEAAEASQTYDSLDKLDTDKKLINSDKLSQEQKDFTFNLDATGDALNTQIKNAQSLRKALVEAYGDGSEQVKAFDKQLDYLLAKKGSEESKTTWEDVSKGQGTLNSALKRNKSKYSFDIDWSSEDLSYYQGQIENLDKALTETDKDGNVKVKMDDSELKSTLALVDQLQQKEWELSNNNVSAHVDTNNEKVTGNQKTMIEEFDQIQTAANHLQNLNQKKKMGFAVDKKELSDAKKNLTDYVNEFVAAHDETSKAMGLTKIKKKDANKIAKNVTSKQAGDYLSEMGVDKSAWKNTSKTKSTGGGGSTKKSITVAIKGENKIDKLKEKMASVENKKAQVTVTTPGSKKVTNLKKNIDEVSGTTAEAQVTAKVSGGGKVKNLKQNVEAMDGKTASAQVTATTSGTKKVHNLKNAISQVQDKTVQQTAKVSGTKKVNNLVNAINSLHSKTIDITTNYVENHTVNNGGGGSSKKKPKGGGHNVNGTAHAHGTAFANGSWGARKSGLSLVGELGKEIIVRGSKWFTVGDNGAEMVNIRQDDIIFNHKQSEEILKNGYVTSGGGRGKMAKANGSAHANGSAYVNGTWGGGKWNIYTGVTNLKPIINTASNVQQAKQAAKQSAAAAASDADKFLETMDWIEIKIKRLEDIISDLDAKASSAYRKFSDRNQTLGDEFTKVTEEIQLQKDAYNAYLQKANSIGLSEDYKNKVRNGMLSIEDITDETLKDNIDNFQNWYDKAEDCKYVLQDLEDKLGDIVKTKFDNINDEFSSQLEIIEHENKLLETQLGIIEGKGMFAGQNYFTTMLKNQEVYVEKLHDQYMSLSESMYDALDSGKVQEGSSAYYEMIKEINGVSEAWYEAKKQLVDYKNEAYEMNWSIFEKGMEYFSDITDESEFLQNILRVGDNDIFVKETGRFNDKGNAINSLHAMNYGAYMAEADKYKEKAAELNAEIEKDSSNTKLIDKRNEYIKQQREMIQNANSEKKSIHDLVEESYNKMLDILQKLIDKRKDFLQNEKDLYQYSKDIEEQVKSITDIKKQLNALGGDDSEETQSKVQSLKDQLKKAETDLEGSEYDQYITDQEKLLDNLYTQYEEVLNTRLDNIDGLLTDAINHGNENAENVRQTITEASEKVGYDVSEGFNRIWNSTDNGVGRILSEYSTNFLSSMSTITEYLLYIFHKMGGRTKEEAEQDRLKAEAEKKRQEELRRQQEEAKKQQQAQQQQQSQKNNISQDTIAGIAAAIWCEGNSGWGNDPFRSGKLTEKIGAENARKVQDYINAHGYNGDLYRYWINNLGGNASRFHYSAFKTGGYTGNNEGFAMLHAKERVLNATQTKAFETLVNDFLPDVSKELEKLRAFSLDGVTNKSMNSNISNDISLNLSLPNVSNANDFVKAIQTNRTLQQVIKAITIDEAMGKNTLSKFKY